MTPEQIKASTTYKLANRLYILSSLKQTKRVVDEYNLIVEEMWERNEIYKSDKGVKKITKTKRR